MPKKSIEISVVVPVYNEKGNVATLYREIVAALNKMKKSYEIIFVDDGSFDGTFEELKKLKPLTVIRMRQNTGQSTALETGIQNSSGKILITLDGDGQNDPKDFSRLLAELNKGYDAVCGWRYHRQDSTSKKFISSGAKFLRNLLVRDNVHDSGCTLRIYHRYCFDEVHLYGQLHRLIPALLKMRGFRLGEVKVNHRARSWGDTKYSAERIMNGFLDMIQVWINQRFNKRPLYLFGGIGLVLIAASTILLTALAIMRMFFEYHLSDKIWPLAGMFGFLTGVQLLIFGIIADLIIRNNKDWLAAPIRSIERNE